TARIAIGSRERGDDEARIGFALRPLGLGDDAARAAPALAGRPSELLEAARRRSRGSALLLRRHEVNPDRAVEAGVLGQPQDEVDRMGLAPRHQRLARKAGVGAHDDADLGPARTDLLHDARDLLNRPRRTV